jgi:hypothetical protein
MENHITVLMHENRRALALFIAFNNGNLIQKCWMVDDEISRLFFFRPHGWRRHLNDGLN